MVCTGTAKESNVNSVIADVTLEIYGSNRTVTAALEPDGDEIAFDVGLGLQNPVSLHFHELVAVSMVLALGWSADSSVGCR